MGEKLPGLTRWTGRVSGPQRSQSLGHHRPPWGPRPSPAAITLIPRGRSPAEAARRRRVPSRTRGGGDGARAPGAARPSRAAPPRRPALTHPAHTRARARARSKAGASLRAEEPCGRLGASSFCGFRPLPRPGRRPAPPPNPPARGRGGRRRAVRRGGRGRRFPRGAWAAGLGLRAGCGGAALTCGRRRRAGQRAPGARAARGRADGGARGRAAPLPSSEEAPAVRRGPGRARLTSSILSGAGGARGEGRPPRGLRRARAGSPCARPPASLTETPEATGSAGAPSAGLLRVWVPCPPAGQSQRRDWSVFGAAQLSLPLCSAQQRNPLVNSGLVYGGSKYSKDRNIRLCTTFSTAD